MILSMSCSSNFLLPSQDCRLKIPCLHNLVIRKQVHSVRGTNDFFGLWDLLCYLEEEISTTFHKQSGSDINEWGRRYTNQHSRQFNKQNPDMENQKRAQTEKIIHVMRKVWPQILFLRKWVRLSKSRISLAFLLNHLVNDPHYHQLRGYCWIGMLKGGTNSVFTSMSERSLSSNL